MAPSVEPFHEVEDVDADMAQFLEYVTFRIPYEQLNREYRKTHKEVERASAGVRQASALVKSFVEANDTEKISKSYRMLMTRLRDLRDLMSTLNTEEKRLTNTMVERSNYLMLQDLVPSISEPDPGLVRWNRNQERVIRYAIGHLLRCGLIESARLLASKTGMEQLTDIDVFERAYKVQRDVEAGDVSSCLEWINDHRSKLNRINSKLEKIVRVQYAVQLLKDDRMTDCIAYVRQHLAKKSRDEYIEDMLKLMGLIGVGLETNLDSYKKLLDDGRWKEIAALFREEFNRVYEIPYQSAFSLCVQCGLAAYKTPECAPGSNKRCPTCEPTAYILSKDLPHAHTGHSSIHCAFTGEHLNEDNPPFLLATGRVVGERSIYDIRGSFSYWSQRFGLSSASKEVVGPTDKLDPKEIENTNHFAGSGIPRRRTPNVKFRVGDVIRHKLHGYRGLIVGWDHQAAAPAQWIKINHMGHKSWTTNPNYLILIDGRDRPLPEIAYVAQENLVIDSGHINHYLVRNHFEHYDEQKNRYLMRPFRKSAYPED